MPRANIKEQCKETLAWCRMLAKDKKALLQFGLDNSTFSAQVMYHRMSLIIKLDEFKPATLLTNVTNENPSKIWGTLVYKEQLGWGDGRVSFSYDPNYSRQWQISGHGLYVTSAAELVNQTVIKWIEAALADPEFGQTNPRPQPHNTAPHPLSSALENFRRRAHEQEDSGEGREDDDYEPPDPELNPLEPEEINWEPSSPMASISMVDEPTGRETSATTTFSSTWYTPTSYHVESSRIVADAQ